MSQEVSPALEPLEDLFRLVRGKCYIQAGQLINELETQTLKAEDLARIHAETKEAEGSYEHRVKRKWAELHEHYRNCGEKMSLDDIKAAIILDPEYQELQNMQVLAKAADVYMDDMAKAWDGRNTSLTSLRKLMEAEAAPRS